MSLRVLLGLHAGASLPLVPGRYRIGAEEADADTADRSVVLLDWTLPPLTIEVDAAGAVSLAAQEGEADSAVPQAWPELQARRFGEVVLCVGDSDGAWPSDAELLDCLQPGPVMARAVPAARPASWGMRAGLLGAGLLAAVTGLYGRSSGPPPHTPPPARPEYGAQLLQQDLARRGLDELTVRPARDAVVLSGLVRDADQGRTVHTVVSELERSTGVAVLGQWEVADDIASTIEAALRQPGVNARYLGGGRFQVEGIVADPARLRAAGAPLVKDLGMNVKGIDFALERKARPSAFSAAIAADALRYAERPDGAKVFSRNERD
ncbi:hypothetical protein GT347_19660 [Xylophilus rhododendri]|uniref:Type III secretion apparatus protein, YscD/HrpQ family n=1 Tax=Xylophilus rhododendri TaxID=2697032 RepID=A0A857JA43_9BURK|nr:hypothetical protein [Xylophilus rhododendri]QHJ00002.1 hypothetical protein GT347_19660 [Xylophilus rhododendri]